MKHVQWSFEQTAHQLMTRIRLLLIALEQGQEHVELPTTTLSIQMEQR